MKLLEHKEMITKAKFEYYEAELSKKDKEIEELLEGRKVIYGVFFTF
jgi:hypothetical protein